MCCDRKEGESPDAANDRTRACLTLVYMPCPSSAPAVVTMTLPSWKMDTTGGARLHHRAEPAQQQRAGDTPEQLHFSQRAMSIRMHSGFQRQYFDCD